MPHGSTVRQVALISVILIGLIVPAVGIAPAEHKDLSPKEQAHDGDTTNGEELRSALDKDNPVQSPKYTTTLASDSHGPGASKTTLSHFAAGWTENFTLHYIVGISKNFDYSQCEPTNAQAFGIDRKNDDSGTKTDESLLSSYKSFTSTKDKIVIGYYRESQLAGEPINISIADQFVGKVANCNSNPQDPGWYRMKGYMNGSTNGDTKTDFQIVDWSSWVYVCDCSSEQEAIEKLGPKPSTHAKKYKGSKVSGSQTESGGSTTATPQSTASAPSQSPTATTKGTASGNQGSQATVTQSPRTRQTRTAGGQGATSPTGTKGSSQSSTQSTAATNTARTQSAGTTQAATADSAATITSTSSGNGPGFSIVVTIAGLVAALAMAIQRRL